MKKHVKKYTHFFFPQMLRNWSRRNPYRKQLRKLFQKAEEIGLAERNTVFRAIIEEKMWDSLIDTQGKNSLKRRLRRVFRLIPNQGIFSTFFPSPLF